MEEVEKLLTTAVAELEKILSSKTVVGEPITIGEATMIPLVSVGFASVPAVEPARRPGRRDKDPAGARAVVAGLSRLRC